MRCPSCGYKNSELATHCASCGSTLPLRAGDTARHAHSADDAEGARRSSPVDDTAPHPPIPDDVLEDTHRQQHVDDITQGTAPQPYAYDTDVSKGFADDAAHGTSEPTSDTAQQPQSTAHAPSSAEAEPEFRQVASAAGLYAAAKRRRALAFFHTHQKTVGLVMALLVAAVLGVVWLTMSLLDAPTYTSIEKDIAALIPTYTYAGGTYGPDLEIPLSSIAVTKRTSTRTPEGMDATEGVWSVAYAVEAEATYDDGKIRAVRNVGTTYVRKDSSWQMTGELAERGRSLTARAGADEEKVMAQLDSILDVASADGGTSLADLYEDGSFSVVGNSFKEAANKDTATNDITIHCAKKDGFVAYEGNVTARFAFESGTWSLRSAKADEHADVRSFSPLVGSWSGKLTSTESTSASCYGAQHHKLEVTIDSVGDTPGDVKVTGTVTVLAHYHHKLSEKADSCEGDRVVERIPFTGVIRDAEEKNASGFRLEAKTTGTADGELSFEMDFGTADESSEVTARVTSTHTYQETVLLFIPHQTTSKFIDNYLVSHA